MKFCIFLFFALGALATALSLLEAAAVFADSPISATPFPVCFFCRIICSAAARTGVGAFLHCRTSAR
ncbi:hypothetical protein BT96DRAFT_921527 [Gymnopus androsaceus JB14]|uniref:Secreted protein n=1 Tax=Gymnopus androsaceus JB14 TaxID=1447944 RepID=A0A6A4HJ41_9AGAR|nr:hypothetical protein BT96DRAFT_921527 [Gymnopus androsaceus JB14]